MREAFFTIERTVKKTIRQNTTEKTETAAMRGSFVFRFTVTVYLSSIIPHPKKKEEYKPGSVIRNHLSAMRIAPHFVRPTCNYRFGIISYRLTLLRMRLAMRYALPHTRWALTPPFHPYPLCGRFIFCCAVCMPACGLSPVRRHPGR